MPALRWGFVMAESTVRLGRQLTRMMAIPQRTQMTPVARIVRTKTSEAVQLRSQLDARRWRAVFGEPVSFGDYGLKGSYCIKKQPRRQRIALRNDMKGTHCWNSCKEEALGLAAKRRSEKPLPVEFERTGSSDPY